MSRTGLRRQQRSDKPEEMLKPLSRRRILGAFTRLFNGSSNTVSTDQQYRNPKVHQQRTSWRQTQATQQIRHNQNR
ncbi:MAG: hypothetical protein JSV35_00850 [Candidatus Bathyarchaeota archaeon]|nr:MAG: hypothetical protein JSV35_00850 [Candidatus Bathyarchaeota archaeon]